MGSLVMKWEAERSCQGPDRVAFVIWGCVSGLFSFRQGQRAKVASVREGGAVLIPLLFSRMFPSGC